MRRYLAGLCVCSLGACGGGWLLAVASWSASGHWDRGVASGLATGAWLLGVSVTGIACWAVGWRRRLRADGVLPVRPGRQLRREARLAARAAARQAKVRGAAARGAAGRGAGARGAGARGGGPLRMPERMSDAAAHDDGQLLAELRTLLGPLLAAADAADAEPCGHDSPEECEVSDVRLIRPPAASASASAAGVSAAGAPASAVPASTVSPAATPAGVPRSAGAPASAWANRAGGGEMGGPRHADGGVTLLCDAEEAW